MLTCKDITEIVTDYLEGRLSLLKRMQFHMHLGMCGPCRAYVRQMKATIEAAGEIPEEPLPPALREELLRRFRSWKK